MLDVSSNNTINSLLRSMGIGIASGAAIYALISHYLDTVIQSAYQMPYLNMMAMFSIDKGLSIILGAILTRASYESMNLSFVKKGG